jgi:hypothetical protein
MQAKYPLKIQAIRSKNQQARLYVYFPLPLAAASVWELEKKCSGNCWIAANYTWSETNHLKSKPLKGPPNPPKIRSLPKNRLLKPNDAVYLTEVTHNRPVSEN